MPDYTVADTIYKRFTTRAFATGIPTVLAGTPVVSAYEDDSTIQITAGITLGVDHDSVAGLNLLTIVATGANGYEAGKSYDMVITTGTVGGVSAVGEVVWHFTLSAEAAAVDLANGTDGLGAIKTDTAAILVDTSTTLQAELDAIQAAVITNAAGVDIAADIIAVKAETALIVADTNELQTDWTNAGRLDAILDIIAADVVNIDGAAMRGTDDAFLAANVPTNFADMSITVTTGLVDITQAAADKTWGTAARILTASTNFNDISIADVNTQVLDVMNTDTITLPGQEAPPLTPTHRQAIAWLYKVFRNRKTQTATQWSLLADNETTVDAKATVSDDATTAIKQEVVTGP